MFSQHLHAALSQAHYSNLSGGLTNALQDTVACQNTWIFNCLRVLKEPPSLKGYTTKVEFSGLLKTQLQLVFVLKELLANYEPSQEIHV